MNLRAGKVLLAVVLLVVVAGCGKKGTEETGAKTVRLVYVNWAEGIAITNLAQAVLEDKMDYKVTKTMADVAPAFASVAGGDNDAFLDVWLPVTHKTYIDRYGKRLVNLGPVYENARIGLVVPDYVEINTIPQLNGVKDKFDGRIVGIDSGAGIMSATEEAIKAYNLNYKLIPSSGPAMTASLSDAIKRNEPIVVTGWRPHWMFARWDLKFLQDPKDVYGKEERIDIVVRKGFPKDNPRVTGFFRNMSFTDEQLAGLMNQIEVSKGTPLKAARTWMRENQDVVDKWIPAKEEATKQEQQ